LTSINDAINAKRLSEGKCERHAEVEKNLEKDRRWNLAILRQRFEFSHRTKRSCVTMTMRSTMPSFIASVCCTALLVGLVDCFSVRQKAFGVSRAAVSDILRGRLSCNSSSSLWRFSLHSCVSSTHHATSRQPQKQSSSCLHLNNVADRYFQLEEAEDIETSTSEVFLNADHTLFFGETDGPLPSRVSGSWDQQPDGSFSMNISRTFQAGQPESDFTDMGEFTFTVERIFEGEFTQVGASLAMSGTIHDVDDVFGDRQVGFFNMIDTTDAKLDKNDSQGLPQFGRTQTSR